MNKQKQTEAINLLTLVTLRTAELAQAAAKIQEECDKLATRVARYLAELGDDDERA